MDGKFYLNKGDHKKLFTYFKSFYVHRVQFIGKGQEYMASKFDSYEPLRHVQQKPQISEKTTMLAERKRQKLLGGKDSSEVKQVDIFLLPKVDPAKIEAKKK